MKAGFLPWFVAIVGLLIPLAASGLELWMLVVAWLCVLAATYFFAGASRASTAEKVAAAVLLLPLLWLLGWVGGWWLIPADLTWLMIVIREFRAERTATTIAP